MKFTVTTKDLITPSLNTQGRNISQILPKAYQFFLKTTPIDTGNARRNTYTQGKRIEADYDYATPLDRGWSKQAPKGMTKPTMDYVKQLLRQAKRK